MKKNTVFLYYKARITQETTSWIISTYIHIISSTYPSISKLLLKDFSNSILQYITYTHAEKLITVHR